MNNNLITVSQLNAYLSKLIGSDPSLKLVLVEGELSNVNINSRSGHMYFTLKDSSSVIRAVMFSWSLKNLRFYPEEGMKVIVRAQVTVYEPSGQYQLRVEDMQPDGVGALAMQLEQLKKKLSAEGLFDPARKKPIPTMPSVVGVITSPTGAAIRDIVQIINRRFPCAQIVLAPVLVQGAEAPAQLIRAVRLFSEYRAADVLIIGRGGGSMEDLWAFNDEGLARAIYDCEIPVISAVGHETDTTICDYVSDLRAPTPSAAAELAVPDKAELSETIDSFVRYSGSVVNSRMKLVAKEADSNIKLLLAKSPMPVLENYSQQIDGLLNQARSSVSNRMNMIKMEAQSLFSKCEALNPVAVLNRGFAVVSSSGKSISSIVDVKSGDELDITLKDGKIEAVVK